MILILLHTFSAYAGDHARNAAWLRIMNSSEFEYRTEILNTVFDENDRYVKNALLNDLQESMHGNKFAHVAPDKLENYQGMIIRRLGILNDKASAENIYYLMENTGNSALKREAVTALGKIGAVRYGNTITDMLTEANSRQYFLTESGYVNAAEENALDAAAAVDAIENMYLEQSYEPVFRAYACGYPKESNVASKAEKVLFSLSPNPTSELKKIASKENNPEVLGHILDIHEASEATLNEKGEVASVILNKAAENGFLPGNYIERSCYAIEKAESSVSGGEKAVKAVLDGNPDKDIAERIIAIAPYCKNGSRELDSYLRNQIKLNQAGKGDFSQREKIVAVINTLGNTGSREHLNTLIRVRTAGWPENIVSASEQAIDKILGR